MQKNRYFKSHKFDHSNKNWRSIRWWYTTYSLLILNCRTDKKMMKQKWFTMYCLSSKIKWTRLDNLFDAKLHHFFINNFLFWFYQHKPSEWCNFLLVFIVIFPIVLVTLFIQNGRPFQLILASWCTEFIGRYPTDQFGVRFQIGIVFGHNYGKTFGARY